MTVKKASTRQMILNEGRQRRDDEHPVKERCLWRQHEHGGDGEEESGRGDSGTKPAGPFTGQPKGENDECGQGDDRFRQGKSEKFEIHRRRQE